MHREQALTLRARGELGKALGWPGAQADLDEAERARQALEADEAEEKGAEGSLSLADRFPRVLDAGRRIASALSRDAVLQAVQAAAQELLRSEHCLLVELG